MSVYKQLWLAIFLLMALAFAGILIISILSAGAYPEPWPNIQTLAGYFFLAMIFASLAGSYLLKLILKPLNDIVVQAEAIGQRRFITISEPNTQEFKVVARAMNTLSGRIKSMLQSEASRLEKIRVDTQVDKITGLMIREPFMKLLASAMERDDASASGAITLVRISDLTSLNHIHGRGTMDNILSKFGSSLNKLGVRYSGWAAGRLNGSDFAVLAPHAQNPAELGEMVQQAFFEVLQYENLEGEVKLPGASASYGISNRTDDLLFSLDANLLASKQEGESTMNIVHRGDVDITSQRQGLENWRKVLQQSFQDGSFSLAAFPVTDLTGKLIHIEAPVRLKWQDELLSAAQLLPWVNRLELAGELDKQVITLALEKIKQEAVPVCVNLSVHSVTDPGFLFWLTEKLTAHHTAAQNLWMEVQEPLAFRHLEGFRNLCTRGQHHGCKIGIEHIGHKLTDIGRLHDVGLDYIKIDSAFIRGVDKNTANQTLLRTLCTLVHAVGSTAIAEGVQSEGEWDMLDALGFDGATGAEVSNRQQYH